MEVLTTAEMERGDQLTIAAGTPGFALMLSAGQAVAEAAMDLVEEGPVVVVAGRGNNGGGGVFRPPEQAAPAREVSVMLFFGWGILPCGAASPAPRAHNPVLPLNPQASGETGPSI